LQKTQRDAQRRNLLGKSLVGASFGPILLGTTLVWLAQDDFRKARSIRDELEAPSSATGPNYQEKVKENRDAVNDGRGKMIVGSSLIGVGLILGAFGLSIWF